MLHSELTYKPEFAISTLAAQVLVAEDNEVPPSSTLIAHHNCEHLLPPGPGCWPTRFLDSVVHSHPPSHSTPCATLHHIAHHHTTPNHTTPHHTTPHHITSHHITSHQHTHITTPHHPVLRCSLTWK